MQRLPTARTTRLVRGTLVAAVAVALATAGSTGVVQYVRTYWLYRGFPPPSAPTHVIVRRDGRSDRVTVTQGVEQVIDIRGAAIGGRSYPAYVYLPPGYYQHPRQRYPVFYMLHGSPGGPINFLRVVDLGVAEDILVAERQIRPMILVAPTGGPSFFSDEEWGNGVRPGDGWETYVTTDVVNTIDRLYRTIPRGADRAIAGLSEGGYGALNLGIHHPGEFRVLESWSGYMDADRVPGVWGAHPPAALLAYNSPAIQIRRVLGQLRRHHTYIWFYCGRSDPLLRQNKRFAAEMATLRLPFRFQIRPGGHSWDLWRSMVDNSLLAASSHLGVA